MEKIILKNLFYKNIKRKEILDLYFEWCSGFSNDKYYYVYKGDKAYYDSENEILYLNEDEYFERVILSKEKFIRYIKKYYESWFSDYAL